VAQESIGVRIGLLYDLQASWLEPRFARHGLSFTTFQLLAAVQSAGKSASQVEIARRLGISAATLSEAVFALVKRGWIQQAASSTDRRVKVLSLTAPATKALKAALKEVDQFEVLVQRALSETDINRLAKLMDAVAKEVEQEFSTGASSR